MKIRSLRSCAYGALLLLSTIESVAEEIEEVYVLDAYRATVSSAVVFTNLSDFEIQALNYGQEPSFILAQTPSFTVYSDSGSGNGYSYFRLRGMDQTRINMTLNGAPLNEPEDQGVYFSNYPDFFSSLSAVQVQRGAGLSQNGTASYAGSIQFSSKDLSGDDGALLEANYGSFGSHRVAAEYKNASDDGLGWFIRGASIGSDGYKRRSANRSSSVFTGANLETEKGEWTFTGFSGKQKNQLAWLGVDESDLQQDARSNANSAEDDVFQQSLIIVNQEQEFSHFSVSSGIYYNELEGNYDFDLNNFLGLDSSDELFNYAVDSRFVGLFSRLNFSVGDFSFVGGFHVNDYSREHLGSERSLGQLYANEGQKDEASIFAKMSYDLGKTRLLLDVQQRRVRFNYQGTTELDELEWQFFNPKFGVSRQINDALNVYYSLGRTSREPTRTDIFGGNDNLELDNSGRPNIFITQEEQVLDQALGLRFKNSVMSIDLNFYHMDFENEIVLNGQFGPNGLALNDDVDSSIRQGVELSSTVSLDEHWSLYSTFSVNDSRITDEGQQFEHLLSPTKILLQGIRYQRDKLSLAMDVQYQSESFIDFANSQQTSSYHTLNARAFYQMETFGFGVFLRNITDRDYYRSGYVDFDGRGKFFVGAPLSASVAVNARF